MKYVIISLLSLSFFISNNLYAQFRKNIDEKNIEIENFKYLSKQTKKPLNGSYKVKITDSTYYTAHFKKGKISIKDKANVVKYYTNNHIDRIHIYFDVYYAIISKNYFNKGNTTIPIRYMWSNDKEKVASEINGNKETILPAIDLLILKYYKCKDKDIEKYIRDNL